MSSTVYVDLPPIDVMYDSNTSTYWSQYRVDSPSSALLKDKSTSVKYME